MSPRFQIVLRGGAGNAWAAQDDITFDSLHAGASLGMALSTPVGPLEVDVGVGGGRLRLYVAIGFQ
jgi:outer membrane translocation and assembly module TamA